MGVLNFDKRPSELSELRACAAVGQSRLMAVCEQLFGVFGLSVAQILLTHEDRSRTERGVSNGAEGDGLARRRSIAGPRSAPRRRPGPAWCFPHLSRIRNELLREAHRRPIPVQQERPRPGHRPHPPLHRRHARVVSGLGSKESLSRNYSARRPLANVDNR
jgi:hypothetical protein